ncbi:copper resistance protein B [Lysobacter sp. M15]|uniref:copper resistance protein B n=1 Tax=Lysobacter sp. M15 TaxID=2916837 RepID=UPI001F5847AA|nr:copper resistance protein B [Lysobacter sp. M15]
MTMRTLAFATLAPALLLAAQAVAQGHAQHQMPVPAAQDHTQHQTKPKEPAKAKPAPKKKPKASREPAPVDHAAMGHAMPTAQQPGEPVDHAAMGHTMPTPSDEPRTPIPEVTDADRAAAFAHAGNHAVHDNTIQYYVLLDRLEAFDADEGTGLEWEAQSWIGTDLNKLWLRSEGERTGGHTEAVDLEVLYGRAFAPWWDLVVGVRHDFEPGDSQDFLAIGVMGLAPYKFEVEATAYLGERGQTAARFEVEYETLLTNRLILQPQIEVNLYGKDDLRRGIGSGLSTAEAGLRLRYEFTRQFAPYIGIVHERAFGRTADFRRDEGEDADDTRLVAGVRIWF